MPAGRMLKKEIMTSDKINGLSFAAALLFTWAIPFEDSAGYIEAEPRWLKHNVFPARDDMSVNDVAALAVEIIKSGAWIPFKAKDNGKRYVWDPKFEEKQSSRPKYREAESPFATRVMHPNSKGEPVPGEIKELHIGLEQIPLEEVEKVWQVPSHSGGTPLPATPPNSPRSSPPESSPEKPKVLTVKKMLEENPEMNDLVNTLRGGKFPEVGSFLGKCLKEIKGIQVEDLKQTLQAILDKHEWEGEIFPYAVETLKSIVNENVTRRVEDQSQKFKEEEAGGPQQVGKILKGLREEK